MALRETLPRGDLSTPKIPKKSLTLHELDFTLGAIEAIMQF